jgi:hypothetical protein
VGKTYNALTGKELKTIVLKEVQQGMALDPRFDREDPVTSASVVFTLRIEHYPSGEQPFEVQVSNLFKPPAGESLSPLKLRTLLYDVIKLGLDGDIRFSEHLTYPNVTCQHLTDITLTRPDGGTVSRSVQVVPETESIDPRRIDLTTRQAVVQASPVNVLTERELKLAALRQQIQDLEGTPLVPAQTSNVALSPGETRHRDYEPFTGTGLPLEAGFKPSPGPAMAGSFGGGAPVGAVQGQDVVEHIALGVTHNSVDDGGLGSPDAVRREHGLFVPEQRSSGGQVFDIPSGSF